MIFNRLSFSISQRIFWKSVRSKRSAWESLKLNKNAVTVPVSELSQIKLATTSELSSHIYCGAFEWAEREWLLSELKAGDVFYDIGANIGYFTILAAERCGSSGKVIAFEPVKSTFDQLTENVLLNPHLRNVQLMNLAVSDKEGEENIYVPDKGKDAWNSIAVKPESGEYKTEVIRTIVPDKLFADKSLPAPSIIKLDVEGWELHALRGMQTILSKSSPVLLIEFTAMNLEAAGTSGSALAEFLHRLNYSLFEYEPRFKRLNEVSEFEFEHKNLIAKKKS